MMRPLISLLLAAAACFAQQPSAPTEESRLLFAQVDEIMNGLSQITGWKVKKKVPADFITKEQLHDYVESRLKDVVKPEELRIESLTLKMFGLVPENFDLEKATVELVTEQAAAFYDYNKKRLFITESSATFIEQRIVLVHELAHALADQQFSLSKFIRKGGQSDDDATAREAVMEGQATWLMWAYSSKLAGGEPEPSEIILDTMKSTAASSGGAQFPVFESAPLYLRESLVFPYNQGVLFQQAVFQKLGKAAFSEVFRKAPRTTAQILHPEMYFTGSEPAHLKVPDIPDRKKYRMLADGSVGEFDHRILIEQFVSREDATRLSPHWKGGVFQLLEDKDDRRPILTYRSEWDSADSAKEWFQDYRKVLKGKSKSLEFATDTPSEITGRNDRGRFEIHLDAITVSSVEGLP